MLLIGAVDGRAHAQWAALTSSAFGNAAFGQIRNQANNMRMMQFTFRFGF